jgi:putative peptide zinc metalloprotease protein
LHARDASTGTPSGPLELVLPDHTRVPLTGALTIGRGRESALRLADPSVSRHHARISSAGGAPVLEDAGSSYGTWVDGHRVEAATPLHAGSRIRVGDLELLVDRRRSDAEAGATVVVPPNASVTLAAGGPPRLRSGYALKRLEAAEGDRRWVLENLRSGRFVRLSDADAAVFGLIDGKHTLPQLMRGADERFGEGGATRLMRLLVALDKRGFLAGTPEAAGEAPRPTGPLRRLVAPHNVAWPGAGAWFERLYRGGGWMLLRRPVLAALAVLAAAGVAAFVFLVVARYGTPFVVASKLGIGGVVFIAGRLAVAAVHECAHGVVLASFGRRVREAGFKRVLIFPYVYVDTSEAWFEPRRRRIAVSAAGPASDLCLGGAFSLCCLASAPGAVRDVVFQLALGAYIAAFFNLNPLVERDGYHIAVDLLREPGLRQRAREQLRRRLAGGDRAEESAVLRRYSVAGIAWSLMGAAIGVAMSLRYLPAFTELAPEVAVWPVMGALWVALFVPALAVIGVPLLERRRARVA